MNNHKGLPTITDPRLTRIRFCYTDLRFLAALLQMDGTKAYRLEGFPAGALIVGATVEVLTSPQGQPLPAVKLILHHPDWPVVLTTVPIVEVKITSIVEVPDASQADEASQRQGPSEYTEWREGEGDDGSQSQIAS